MSCHNFWLWAKHAFSFLFSEILSYKNILFSLLRSTRSRVYSLIFAFLECPVVCAEWDEIHFCMVPVSGYERVALWQCSDGGDLHFYGGWYGRIDEKDTVWQCPEWGDLHFYMMFEEMLQNSIWIVSMPWKGRPPFLPLPLGTCINKGFADPFLQVFSRIFWKRLFWRWFLACSQFVHICRRNESNFSLSAALIITDFFRFHKKIITWAFYTIPYSFL